MSGGELNNGVQCGDCGAPMMLRRNLDTGLRFYGCTRYPDCRGAHACHRDGKPVGVPGDKATRIARIEAHRMFDTAWRARGLTRSEGYEWLQEVMGLPKQKAHISMFTEEQCRDMIARIEIAEAVRHCAEESAEVSA